MNGISSLTETLRSFIFIEADSEMANLCRSVGAFNLPNIYVPALLNDNSIVLWQDGYTYKRRMKATDEDIVKTVFGIPNQDLLEQILTNHFNEFQNFLNNYEKKIVRIDYSRFDESKMSLPNTEIEAARKIINTFWNNLENNGICEYSKELLNRLKENIEKVKRLYAEGQYDKRYGYLYPEVIERGEELMPRLCEYKPLIFRL